VVSGILRAALVCAPVVLWADPPAAEQAAAATLASAIPSQPLTRALAALAQQTGVQLLYVSSIVEDQKSHAVAAGLTARDALARLLEGTGLRFQFLTANSVRILPAAAHAVVPKSPVVEEPPAEVVITASRRAENLQDVAITVQAVTGEQLNALSVRSLDDLLRYTTNVTTSGNGPSTNNIFIRGMGALSTGNQSQATTAPFPNVALYLDEQSMQFPSRNNDVYIVDMERIEVLEGPQGTLFGGGAQAGVIRYVTNKPKLDTTSAAFNAGYGYTAGGGNNSQLDAVLNLPLGESLAFRAVLFSEHQGGYIDNVPSHIGYPANSPQVLAGLNPITSNAAVVQTDSNPIDYQGIRASLLWQFSQDWSALLQQNYQDMDAQGYFYAYPFDSNGVALRPYQIAAFTPAFNKDRYESTSFTINGQFNDFKLIYAGNYMVRHIEAQQDYSNYLRSAGGSYYGCIGTGAAYFNPANFPVLHGHPLQCYAPVGSWNDVTENVHHSQEIRLTSPDDRRLRGLVGAYWEKFIIYDDMNFNYLVIPQCDSGSPQSAVAGSRNGPDCLGAVGPYPGSFASYPGPRVDSNTAFGEDVQRGYQQRAFFVSLDFDLIPKILTLEAGTRYYHYDEFEYGSEYYSESAGTSLLVDQPDGVCAAAGECGFPIYLRRRESGTRSRADLDWKITPDVMAYLLFSQGFRPGAFNRTSSAPGGVICQCQLAPYGAPSAANVDSTYQYLAPVGYGSDTLDNYEAGFKSEFLDNHLLFNLSLYYMKWNNTQTVLYGPQLPVTFASNGPDYRIKGVELQFVWRVTEGLTFAASSSNNSASQVNAPCLRSVGVTANPATLDNPTPAGDCITQINGVPYAGPFAALGSRPPFSPPWMFNVRARYDWNFGDYHPFVWAGASHLASMGNEPANYPTGSSAPGAVANDTLQRYQIPGITTSDAAIGVSRDQWTAQLHGSNLTGAYGPANVTSAPYIKAVVPLRPRVVMAQLTYTF
jgi:iron complex outermembrane recepter protein